MFSKRVIFWSSCAGMLLFGIVLITLGSVIPDLRAKTGMDEVSSGALFSLMQFGILAGSMIFGPVVDKYSYRMLLSLSCVFMAAGFLGIALAHSQGILRVYGFLIGLGGGAVNGATNALVSDISEKDKGAKLSLLGVAFGVGALGMPLILGLMSDVFSFEVILVSVAVLTAATGLLFLVIKFPPPKQPYGFPVARSMNMLKDGFLLMIAFFLFVQSSFEGILNNWTTTYLIDYMSVSENISLYALSAFVAGMAVMRIFIGTVFRSLPERKLLLVSFTFILSGLVLLRWGNSIVPAISGLVLLGAGLAAGFPVMLGLTGTRYAELSGTAFSLVLFIALIGNMTVNYSMGFIARNFGIRHLTTVAFVLLVFMILLYIFLFRNNKRKYYT
jgi:MFS family permease